MKKGRFLWSAHRITEKQKAGKARNIKEKRQLKNFNTVSRQLVVLHSSQRDNIRVGNEPCDSKYEKASPMLAWSEVFLYLLA